MPPRITFIIGCTGCGKSRLGFELAKRTGGEIISIDSMKVYRRMDIGTAKPPPAQRQLVPHHLIDIVEPCEEFSVARYTQSADQAIADVHLRGKPIYVVGGTPLYIKALMEGLFEGPAANPELRERLENEASEAGSTMLHERLKKVDPSAADRIHPNDLRRLIRALEVYELTGQPITELQKQWDQGRRRYDTLLIGLRRVHEDQNHRMNQRVRRMMEAGFVDEVQGLLAESTPLSTAARQALGYAEIIRHLHGELSLVDAVELIKINTRQFAKAQRTWFQRFRETKWVDLSPGDDVSDVACRLMERWGARWSA